MSDNLNSKNVVLLGTGPMAIAYTKVLKSLGVNFSIVGRSQAGIKKFHKQTGITALPNGVPGWHQKGNSQAEYGIIAVSFETSATAAIELMNAGIRKILLEKPAGLTIFEIKKICEKAKDTNAQIFVGYNRRFYSSVLKAQEMIKDDGGIKSFNFEFTEWSDQVKKNIKNGYVLENWFLANSSHIIDLAFFLGGEPEKFHSYVGGGNDWHPTATVFSGAGITNTGALFSYQANWDAPGRWGVEALTRKHRYIFRPLEKLQILKHNTVVAKPEEIDDQLDLKFKPGLYRQTESFLKEDSLAPLLNIHKHYGRVSTYYEKIILGH